MIYRARILVTMEGPPIDDGAVGISGDRIVAAGSFSEVSRVCKGPVIDLGERVVLPGLINAHCHLDYTMLRNAIMPQRSFAEWIGKINAIKRMVTDEDYLTGIARGFEELKQSGVTSVLNIESMPELLWRMPPPPIRTWWFYEMIDVRHRIETQDVVAGALLFFQERPDWQGGFGLSPHAPYTASVELYRLSRECARVAGMLITTHLAESVEESQMFVEGRGPLHEFMARLGRPMHDCGHGSPLEHLLRHDALGQESILVHMNGLSENDFALLAGNAFHIVHCPLSHRYFGHPRFPLQRLRQMGFNISLGTDSLASNERLNLFLEMQAVRKSDPDLAPFHCLEMVTTNPARALQMADRLGKVKPGAFADLFALPSPQSIDDTYEHVVYNQKPVSWMILSGRLVAGEPCFS